MLRNIEVDHIDETNIIVKFIFKEFTPHTQVEKTMEHITSSTFWINLRQHYDILSVPCFDGGNDVIEYTTQDVPDLRVQAPDFEITSESTGSRF